MVVAIWLKFKPTIPEAGIWVNPDPSPSKEPENELVIEVELIEPVTPKLPVIWAEPVYGNPTPSPTCDQLLLSLGSLISFNT